MKCEHHEVEMESIPEHRFLFRIPFTDWHLTLFTYNSRKDFICIECEMDKKDEFDRRHFDAGFDTAINRMYEGKIRL